MRLTDKVRVAWRTARYGTCRDAWYGLQHRRTLARALAAGGDRALQELFLASARDAWSDQGSPDAAHLRAAIAWLVRAQDATPDAGFSLGFFPLRAGVTGRTGDIHSSWLPSYPETTGYIIPTLLNYAQQTGESDLHRRAVQAAEWEIRVQMPSGAVQGGPVCEPATQVPAVFNTGQVIFGWVAAYRVTGSSQFLEGAVRAGDFLLDSMDDSGEYVRNLSSFARPASQVYNVRCSWALYELFRVTGDRRYEAAALRNARRVVAAHQRFNGWFDCNDLVDPRTPLTHTIAYTLQGLLEIGLSAGAEDLLYAVERGTRPLAERVENDGFLAGTWYQDWKPAATWSCLTGSAQLAAIMYRLARFRPEEDWLSPADRLLRFLKRCQRLDTPVSGAQGALGGSQPLLGPYMSGGYPNWATKFLADALMFRGDCTGPARREIHPG